MHTRNPTHRPCPIGDSCSYCNPFVTGFHVSGGKVCMLFASLLAAKTGSLTILDSSQFLTTCCDSVPHLEPNDLNLFQEDFGFGKHLGF